MRHLTPRTPASRSVHWRCASHARRQGDQQTRRHARDLPLLRGSRFEFSPRDGALSEMKHIFPSCEAPVFCETCTAIELYSSTAAESRTRSTRTCMCQHPLERRKRLRRARALAANCTRAFVFVHHLLLARIACTDCLLVQVRKGCAMQDGIWLTAVHAIAVWPWLLTTSGSMGASAT